MAKSVSGFPDFSKDKKAGLAFAKAMAQMDEETYAMAQAAKKAARAKSSSTKKPKASTKRGK